jgi:glycosyltransferase involved in cell wall biosynthesis
MSLLKVSILIPTLGRPDSLARTLDSILAQEAAFDFEVIVLDNGCEDAIQDLVEGMRAKHGDQTLCPYYVPVPAIGLHNARHAGARAARSEILIYVDDDVIAAPGWLQAIVQPFDDPHVHLAGGPCLPQFEAPIPEWLEAFWPARPEGKRICTFLGLLDLGPDPLDVDPNLIWGLNFAIRKQTLFEIGGFHPDSVPWELRRYRGDGETAVTRAILQRGDLAIYQPAAQVFHIVPKERLTTEYLEKRSFLDGISASFTDLRSKEIRSWPQPKAMGSLKTIARSIVYAAAPKRGARAAAKSLAMKSFRAGYMYHQTEVQGDPDLSQWVMRDDYWDAILPEHA